MKAYDTEDKAFAIFETFILTDDMLQASTIKLVNMLIIGGTKNLIIVLYLFGILLLSTSKLMYFIYYESCFFKPQVIATFEYYEAF